MIKVLIVDDDPIIREGLSIILNNDSEIEVVNTLENGALCLDFLKDNDVDIILLDIRMPTMDGITTLKYLNPEQKVIILSTFKENYLIEDAIASKVCGYLLKNSEPKKIINSIKGVYYGNYIYERDIIETMVVKKEKKDFKSIHGLTNKEYEVLECIVDGLNNKEIADKLHYSLGTIKNYVTSILDKTQTRDRTQLVIKYYK